MKQNNLSLDINKQGSRYATHKGAQRSNGSILMAAGMKNVDPNSPIKSSGAKMINDGSGTKNHNTSRQDLLLNSQSSHSQDRQIRVDRSFASNSLLTNNNLDKSQVSTLARPIDASGKVFSKTVKSKNNDVFEYKPALENNLLDELNDEMVNMHIVKQSSQNQISPIIKHEDRPATANLRAAQNPQQKKRIFSGVPPPSHDNAPNRRNVNCGKSQLTMGQTDLLCDLVGIVDETPNGQERQHQGLQGEDDDDLEIGSDYPYANEILGDQINRRQKAPVQNIGRPGFIQSTNTTSYEFKNGLKSIDDVQDSKHQLLKMGQNEDVEMCQVNAKDSNRRLNVNTEENQFLDPNAARNQIYTPSSGHRPSFQSRSIKSRDSNQIQAGPVDITIDHVIDIMRKSLCESYNINEDKFDVEKLIKIDRNVNSVLLQTLESKIQQKVNNQGRSLSKISIDFGPYPMAKNWQLKEEPSDQAPKGNSRQRLRRASRQGANELYLPPDEDNFEHHGIRNLVIKYSEFGSNFKVDDDIHKHSVFYKQHSLNGLLENFVDSLNEHLEPIKEQTQSLDRLAFLFLMIGFLATTILGTIVGYMYKVELSLGIAAAYLLALGIIFYRNNKEMQVLQQSLLLNMAILVYLENQNVFLQRGIRAQIGYMGTWIEFSKERSHLKKQQRETEIQPEVTYKRELAGLQSGGMYMQNSAANRTLLRNRATTYVRNQQMTDMQSQQSGFRTMQRPMTGFSNSGSLHGSPSKKFGLKGSPDQRKNKKYASIGRDNSEAISQMISRVSRSPSIKLNKQKSLTSEHQRLPQDEIDDIEERDEDL